MSLVLPAPTFVRRAMPSVRSSSIKASVPGIVVFTDLPSGPRQSDALHAAQSSTSLSPAEIDDVPLSPIVFGKNEEYEKNRLSFYAPPPARAASSPTSPNDAELSLPVLFSQTNLSSPSLAQAPPSPVFPSVSPPSTSLVVRRKRPLPPLPKVVTHHGSGGIHSMPRHELIPMARSGQASPCSGDDRESDGATAFSLSPSSSPSLSSQSPATSTYTTASSEPPDSARAVEAFLPPRSDSKPKHLALTIPARSQSTPLPQADMAFASCTASPCISVTPASPAPSQPFPAHSIRRKRTRTPSPTSIVTPFDPETDVKSTGTTHPSARTASPSPSLAPSTTSTKSGTRGGSPKSTLRRIASKTRLFGRRTLSSASDPWADEDEETVVGHGHGGSLSLDDAALRSGLRARSESPLSASECEYECASASAGGAAAAFAYTGAEHVPRAMRRVEIAEVTLTPHGDVWEARELEEVIPKLRQLRAPARIRI